MAEVRVLVGTQKGAFVVTSDGARRDLKIEGPHFGVWEVMHVQGSRASPDRLYASQWTDWRGQVLQRSNDGGKSWEAAGNEFAYEGGNEWEPIAEHLPGVSSVEVQTIP